MSNKITIFEYFTVNTSALASKNNDDIPAFINVPYIY